MGTDAPETALEVGRNASGTPTGVTITAGVAAGKAPILFFNYADAGPGLKRWGVWGSNAGEFRVGTQPDAGVDAPLSTRLVITNGGNVGIGELTGPPTHTLEVGGTLDVKGEVTSATFNATFQDVAEWVPSVQKLSAGTVVVLDPERANQVVSSTEAYDTRVAGVVSERPGIALGEGGERKVLVATTGRVKVRVDATKAPVHIGDLLVTEDTPGVAMRSEPVIFGGRKMHTPGTIIGKALEPLAGGVGEILVLLSLQ